MADEIKPEDKKPEGNGNPDAEARIKALEEKLGEMAKTREEEKKFMDGAALVISTITGSDQLTEAFRAELKKQGVVDAGKKDGEQQPKVETPKDNAGKPADKTETSPEVKDVVSSQRGEIIRGFEHDYGIDKLPEEEQKVAKQKIEGFVRRFGWSVQTMPLTVLRENMESAYTATHAEKLREEGKLEGFAQAKSNAAGVMGTITGGAPKPEEEGKLTPEQKKWAEKLHVDPAKAEKTYQERDNEEKRVSPAEKKE